MMYLFAIPFVTFVILTTLTVLALGNKNQQFARPDDEEGITVIKPIKGNITRFTHAIRSMFEQDYENYEIIFSVTERENQEKLKQIAARYPQVTTTIVYGDIDEAVANPKVATIMPAYNLARHEIIVLSDVDVVVPRNYLASINAQMKTADEKNIGLITHPIQFVPNTSFMSRIFAVHLNTFIHGSHRMVSRFFKGGFPIGKSIAFRRRQFEAITSLEELGNYLGEDYMMGKRFRKAGLETSISPVVVRSLLPECSLKSVITRMIRWGIMRAKSNRKAYLGELCLNPLLLYLLLVPLALTLPGSVTVLSAMFAVAYFMKLVAGEMVRASFGRGASPEILTTVISDVIHAGTWLTCLATSAIEWKGKRMYVGRHTKIVSYPASRAFAKSVMLVFSVIVTAPLFYGLKLFASLRARPQIVEFLARSDLYRMEGDELTITALHGSLTNLAFIADINGTKYVVKKFWKFGDVILFIDRLFGPRRDRASLGNNVARFWGEIEGNKLLSEQGWRVPKLYAYDMKRTFICMEYIVGEPLDKLDDGVLLVREYEQFGAELAKLHERGTYLVDNYASHRFYLKEGGSCQLDLENVTKDGDPAWDLSLFFFYLDYLYTSSLRKRLKRAFIEGYRGLTSRMQRCMDVYHEQLAPYGWVARLATHYR